MRNIFSSYPGDPPDLPEGPCPICGYNADECICPECPVCGMQGDPACINTHLPYTAFYREEQYQPTLDRTALTVDQRSVLATLWSRAIIRRSSLFAAEALWNLLFKENTVNGVSFAYCSEGHKLLSLLEVKIILAQLGAGGWLTLNADGSLSLLPEDYIENIPLEEPNDDIAWIPYDTEWTPEDDDPSEDGWQE